ncbi:hypothetical protein CMUS01_01626 [Colletotrichum musicola]|uniref:Uncharacterized protein n=1 Tax=Colletotrichum musicola TaxID=2175873 RepID=A0A8H6U7S8_9PEZI|nr:hypothetical protein CMUS01_01626 [Colletotrichum musicola]
MDPKRQLETFSNAVKLINSVWPTVSFEKRHTKRDGPITREVLHDHVVSLESMFEREILPHGRPSEDTEFEFATILQEAAWWLYERGNFLRSRVTAEKGLDLCERYHGGKRWLRLSALVYDVLGCIANGTNRPMESMNFNSMQLKIRKELSSQSGKEDFELGYAHNQMGCSWMMAKDFKKGAQLFREALDIWHRVPGYTKGLALMEYANLGMSLWLQDQIDEAAEVLEEGQRESEDGLGKMSTGSFRAFADQALSIYGVNEEAHVPEIARTTFLKANISYKVALSEDGVTEIDLEEGAQLLEKAYLMYRQVVPQTQILMGELKESDFDELATFWSR